MEWCFLKKVSHMDTLVVYDLVLQASSRWHRVGSLVFVSELGKMTIDFSHGAGYSGINDAIG